MRFATRSVFFCNKNVLQRVQRDFTIKKKRERPMKRGEREREGKKETNKKRGTLVSLLCLGFFPFFFLSFFGRGKRGGGGVNVSHS